MRCPPIPRPLGRVVRGECGCWGERELKSSPPRPVVLGDKKADLGQTKASPPWQRVLGVGGHDQGHIWRGFAPIIRHRQVPLPTGSRQGLALLPANAIPSANRDAGCSPGYNPWGDGAVRPPLYIPMERSNTNPSLSGDPCGYPERGFYIEVGAETSRPLARLQRCQSKLLQSPKASSRPRAPAQRGGWAG